MPQNFGRPVIAILVGRWIDDGTIANAFIVFFIGYLARTIRLNC